MEEKIIIAGFGGQGIMYLGKLICQAGMRMGLNVTYIPSYGAEVRGGTANCHVVLSDRTIASPVVGSATTLIIMNEPSLLKFESSLSPDGLLLLNSSLIKIKPKRNDIRIEPVPATETAHRLGDVRVANVVMLGRYLRCRDLLSVDIVKGLLTGLNKEALGL